MPKRIRSQPSERSPGPDRPVLPSTDVNLEGLERLRLREGRSNRLKVIKEMIANESIRTQAMLSEMLEKQGILATQSSLSRDLRDLGVRRVRGVYVLNPVRVNGTWDFDALVGLVEAVSRSGPYTTVIHTIADAARLIARKIDEAGWDEVVGTVAGDNTIFLATGSEEDQNRLFERLKKHLSV